MSAAEVITVLMQNVSRQGWFQQATTPFVGSVSADGFRVSRVARERDSFNPMLYGRIRQDPIGSTLHVTMTLHPIVWTFMTIWSSALGIFVWRDPTPLHGVEFLASVLFILAPWLMAAIFFPSGAAKSRALLETCLRSAGQNESDDRTDHSVSQL